MKRWDVVAGVLTALAVAAVAAEFGITGRPGFENAAQFGWMLALTLATAPAVILGVVIARRSPGNAVGALLVLLGTLPHLVSVLEDWAATTESAAPLAGAAAVAPVAGAAWMLHFVGPALLAAFFPTGRLVAPRWRVLVAATIGIPILFAVLNIAEAVGMPDEAAGIPSLLLLGGLLAVLVLSVISIRVRYRRADEVVRRQVRWLAVAASLIPVALLACWLGWLIGLQFDLVGLVLLALLIALSVSVAVAMLRHRLYGFDRLLAGTVRWALLVAAAALIFTIVAVVLGILFGGTSPFVAAIATALAAAALVPLHRLLRTAIDRRFRPLRTRLLAAVAVFTGDVREGRAAPEDLAAALQRAGGEVDVVAGEGGILRLQARAGANLGDDDLRELESAARLPLELQRLRGDLRQALSQTDASRARLVAAADDERRRIQRDLHDGAQSNLVALGLRLRELQRHTPSTADGKAIGAGLGEAVELVQRSITELRQLAQGVRPSALDEGLEPALRGLVKGVPLPVDLSIAAFEVDEPVATAAYYVAAEAVANALKHAQPSRIGVRLDRDADGVRLTIDDDGRGGASDALGTGLAGVRDRVEAAGGRLRIRSDEGTGTAVEAVFP